MRTLTQALTLTSIATAVRSSVENVFAGAAAAYSTRIPAGSTYTGPLLRVRRSSDNAEQDIGATAADGNGNRWLDTSALLTFCGSGSGFVTKWYDQSGNGRDAAQTTAANQPRIVNVGVVDTKNGRPMPIITQQTTSNYGLAAPVSLGALTEASVIAVGASISPPANCFPALGSFINSSAGILLGMYKDPQNSVLYWIPTTNFVASTVPVNQTPYVASSVKTSAGRTGWVNGSNPKIENSATTQAAFTPTYVSVFGGFVGAPGANQSVAEVLFFTTALTTATRQALERNQGTAFGITVA